MVKKIKSNISLSFYTLKYVGKFVKDKEVNEDIHKSQVVKR
jgi:hypothetical protein